MNIVVIFRTERERDRYKKMNYSQAGKQTASINRIRKKHRRDLSSDEDGDPHKLEDLFRDYVMESRSGANTSWTKDRIKEKLQKQIRSSSMTHGGKVDALKGLDNYINEMLEGAVKLSNTESDAKVGKVFKDVSKALIQHDGKVDADQPTQTAPLSGAQIKRMEHAHRTRVLGKHGGVDEVDYNYMEFLERKKISEMTSAERKYFINRLSVSYSNPEAGSKRMREGTATDVNAISKGESHSVHGLKRPKTSNTENDVIMDEGKIYDMGPALKASGYRKSAADLLQETKELAAREKSIHVPSQSDLSQKYFSAEQRRQLEEQHAQFSSTSGLSYVPPNSEEAEQAANTTESSIELLRTTHPYLSHNVYHSHNKKKKMY